MIIVAVILGVVGIVGSILPGLPGPPLSWIGVLLIYFFGGDPMSQTLLFVLLAVTIVVTVQRHARQSRQHRFGAHDRRGAHLQCNADLHLSR